MNQEIFQSVVLDSRKASDKHQINLLKKRSKVVDEFAEQVRELFFVRHPHMKFNSTTKVSIKPLDYWVYYPWRNTLVRILGRNEYYELRSARNRNLITAAEQKIIRNTKLAVIGLSVGNSIAVTLALEGFENFLLADLDTLSLANLNRLRASSSELGLNKAIIAARQIYDLNPYAKVSILTQGIATEKELKKVVARSDLVVDEMDDVVMKIKLRWAARKFKLAVVSAADNGESSVVDIERFDLNPNAQIYHGRLGKIPTKLDNLTFAQKFELINAIVGVELVTSRMKQSLLEVGRSLYSWPQLGGAAQVSAAAAVFAVKGIVLGQPIRSGKYDVNLPRVFFKNYDSIANKKKRAKETTDFFAKQTKMFKHS